MNVAANHQLLRRAQHHFAESIRIVHGVEKRETRIDARRGQDREEGAVRAVLGIAVAARIVVAPTEPRLDALPECGLPAAFDGACAGTLGEKPPSATLQ